MVFDKRLAKLALSGAVLSFVCLPALAAAQDNAKVPAKADSSDDAAPAIDPDAMKALDKMGNALRDLKQFSIDTTTTKEIVLVSGQKIQLDGTVSWKVKRPNKLFVQVKSARKDRQFFYDGKDLTIFSPRLNYYTSLDGINESLRDFVLRASNDYGIELPISDLFFWGTKYVSEDIISSAMDVGPGTMNGEEVEHYAFRQPGVDWQAWISDSTSLPLKLVITNTDDPAQPEYTARLTWNTSASFPDSTFSFSPPNGASKIKFTPAKVDVVEED